MGKIITKQDYSLRCQSATKDGIKFLGFKEPFKGNKTKVKILCKRHGIWDSSYINNILSNGRRCPECHREKDKHFKSDAEHIQDFFSTGSFPNETKFWRSDKVDSRGNKPYWNYFCPICSQDKYVIAGLHNGIFESHYSTLKRGEHSCRCAEHFKGSEEMWLYRLESYILDKGLNYKIQKVFKSTSGSWMLNYTCSSHGDKSAHVTNFLSGHFCKLCVSASQDKCYVILVSDGSVPIALKFGLAGDVIKRISTLKRSSCMDLHLLVAYQFANNFDSLRAENVCKNLFKCGILTKRELKDGYTETTSITNYDAIVKIFENYGGVRIK